MTVAGRAEATHWDEKRDEGTRRTSIALSPIPQPG
jgi:hypothetical protein